jgi:hypothetical protein
MKRVLAKNNWDFVLYELDGQYIFKVVFYSSYVDTSRKFILSEEEANLGFEELKKLSERIRNDYEQFKDREITS